MSDHTPEKSMPDIEKQAARIAEILASKDQPCDNFTQKNGGLYNSHQCPDCHGIRKFCDNCFTDHHVGGWVGCRLVQFMVETNQAARHSLRAEIEGKIEQKYGKKGTMSGSFGFQGIKMGVEAYQTPEDKLRDDILQII